MSSEMSSEICVPALPESVADAQVAAWHRQPGDPVRAGENLVDLETDKVVLEVPAPADGVLGAILVPEGATVRSGDPLARLDPPGTAAAPAPTPNPAPTPVASVAPEPVAAPAARRLLKELDLDARAIPGSGRDGRIQKADVMAWLDARDAETAHQDPETAAAARAFASTADANAGTDDQRPEKRVPMTRLRARIAERLLEVRQTTAMLTTFNEVNLRAVLELRARHRDGFEKTHGVRLGLMSFFVKATVEALRRFPVVNAMIDGADIVHRGYYDIGIAVSTERGLVVPILRDCDRLDMAAIEQGIAAFGARAKDGSLTLEDLAGGTFTITNGGIFGSLLSTPLLNPPQSAILGMHKIQERPIVEQGQIIAAPMMYLALSYDHRLIDGREAVGFLVAVKEMLEDPARLLLRV